MGWGTVDVVRGIGLMVLGMLVWTVFEYALHRFLFHMKLDSAAGKQLLFLIHGNHHADPGDRYRNMMPLVVSVTLGGLCWAGFVALAGRPGSLLFLGFGLGYVIYDTIHYACHQWPMRGPVLKQLKRHHLRHHYARTDGNYSISAIFWDRLLGTGIPGKRQEIRSRRKPVAG
ncbi:sterol desaturase family protein [Novosphingobium sp. CF614]|uniref:sterol desaturase family protein n=1 Tax=Novosphingobium sp. CF614 TaxID=1884364 RepID=UPI0021011B5D|nr:sterol desaturase family protein [Novosphingobium sp. CF614]